MGHRYQAALLPVPEEWRTSCAGGHQLIRPPGDDRCCLICRETARRDVGPLARKAGS